MTSHAPPFYVVTGGPGSGKTSLIAELATRGYAVVCEAGRAIIREEIVACGRALPWDDRSQFADRMLARDLAAYRSAGQVPTFFDRGVPDVIGYLTLCRLPVSETKAAAAASTRYQSLVFLAPYWPEIFTNDDERQQDLAEAEKTGRIMWEVYASLGYSIVELPRIPIDKRADFVIEACGLS